MPDAPATAGGTARVFAPIWPRAFAGVIDLAAITIPSLIVSRLLRHAPYRLGDLAVTALVAAYFILSYSETGQGYSAGKIVFGMKVVDREGRPLTLPAATVRWLLSIGIALPLVFLAAGFERGIPLRTGPAFAIGVPILCLVVLDSYLSVANRESHQSLHDLAAGSFVVRRAQTGPVPATAPLARAHYAWMAALCLAVALWFGRVYPWARVIGQRTAELWKARAVALATGKASTLVLAPGFAVQAGDTAWIVSAVATIHARPRTEFEAEALRKALACTLARQAPFALHSAELDLMVTFDAGSHAARATTEYMADLELTPEACKGT